MGRVWRPWSWKANVGMSQEVCRDAMRGRCTRGSSCRYYHPPDAPEPVGREVCRDFMRGRCTRGPSCRYLHEGEDMGAGGGYGRDRYDRGYDSRREEEGR